MQKIYYMVNRKTHDAERCQAKTLTAAIKEIDKRDDDWDAIYYTLGEAEKSDSAIYLGYKKGGLQ